MLSWRQPTKFKYHWMHLLTNRLWLAVVIVAIACDWGMIGQVRSAITEPKIDSVTQSNRTVCKSRKTCVDCTSLAPDCRWSLVKQSCKDTLAVLAVTTEAMTVTSEEYIMLKPIANTVLMLETNKALSSEANTMVTSESIEQVTAANNLSTENLYSILPQQPLEIGDAESCPTFTVSYNKVVSKEYMVQVVKVDVANDPAAGDLATLLNQTRIDCSLNGKEFLGATAEGGRQILCNTTDTKFEYERRMAVTDQPSAITYFSASMDGVPLEFNHVQDHYLTVYQIGDCRVVANPLDTKCVSCFWDDDVYRYYCRMCIQNDDCNGQYEYCDIRWLNNFTVANSVDEVIIRCPDIKIESIDPLYAPWAGGTSVQITVTNHKILQMNKVIVVTVAGHRCLLPTTSVDGTQISCMIGPTNISHLNDGPVEVSYVSDIKKSSLPILTLVSDQTFYFVEPEIASVQPTCGRMAGGTLITIRGNFLNAGNSVQAFIGDNITCDITARSQNELTCITGPSETPIKGSVRLEFDQYLNHDTAHTIMFEYTGEPAVDANQTFRGIATGGTRLPVHGRYFKCIEHPFIYVSYKGIQHTGTCNVKNDTYMECRSPTINRPAPYMVTDVKFGFQADFDKTILKLVPPSGSPDYELYPDPVYTDFETDRTGRVVTINGLHLDQGYHLADDLSIRLHNSTIACNVTSVKSRSIVCRTPTSLRPLSLPSSLGKGVSDSGNTMDHDVIVVSFGDKLVYEVKRKTPLPYSRNGPLNLTVLFSGITIISLVITFVVAIVYCMKITLLASTQQTEMQSLCEQQHDNSTTIVEDDKETVHNCKT
ncbi:IPT domain,Immunoglobulin E-set,Immunoglobulin-like fold [Cinara cedri]|uniref:IPT domain,Immunoglobulin E-set,Immunoglobulin-like fold n=1 Tax=Cinara cedri TaxID=506608 RepID=A0A5E4MVM8_9HEMI|nr:IPT domain,Immunoglobulin E-set,Immunoglobulin-like fold [Cinara cedri]